MSQSSPAPRLTFFTFSLNLHFQNICILSVCLSSFLISAVFPSATAFDLLHLSLQLWQVEQRLFLCVHQRVTLFLSVLVHVFIYLPCPSLWTSSVVELSAFFFPRLHTSVKQQEEQINKKSISATSLFPVHLFTVTQPSSLYQISHGPRFFKEHILSGLDACVCMCVCERDQERERDV